MVGMVGRTHFGTFCRPQALARKACAMSAKEALLLADEELLLSKLRSGQGLFLLRLLSLGFLGGGGGVVAWCTTVLFCFWSSSRRGLAFRTVVAAMDAAAAC
ncbi:hypothetical protein Acr_17g0013630 [Actinidia rufa]|uniref:Uncharacterized protein n=1 Tax=Actinidia rufa TaxID=165716 RepID=A0A7J0G4S4_9ERIC|nr:hypothetical protein Acr_17g0013630 [Actinidia rufa]